MNWKIGYYEGEETTVMVSDEGYVVQRIKGNEIAQNPNSSGYLTCMIGILTNDLNHKGRKKIKYKCVSVHRLVLCTFKPLDVYEHSIDANHKDRNKYNNAISNLEWVTHSENAYHQWHTDKICADSKLPKKKISKICDYLEIGTPVHEIGLLTGVKSSDIEDIRLRRAGTNVSAGRIFRLPVEYAKSIIIPYDTSIYVTPTGDGNPNASITVAQAHRICQLLESEKYNETEIAKMTDSSNTIVNGIRRGVIWKDVSKHYKLHPKTRYMAYRNIVLQMKLMGYDCGEITDMICPDEVSRKSFFKKVRSIVNDYLNRVKKGKSLRFNISKLNQDELADDITKAHDNFLEKNPWMIGRIKSN